MEQQQMLEYPYELLIKKLEKLKTKDPASIIDKKDFIRDFSFVFSDYDDWVILSISLSELGKFWMHPTLYPKSKIKILKQQLPDFNLNMGLAYSHVIPLTNEFLA
jgi:hypothetical protein